MKRKILVIILILLILIVIGLSYLKFFVFSGNFIKEDEVQSKNVSSNIVYWQSYCWENYNKNGGLEEKTELHNYYIKINDTYMDICTYEPDECDGFEFSKNGKEYIMHTTNKKLIDANLTVEDDVDDKYENIIKITKIYNDEEGGQSIFYFRSVDDIDNKE